ncbi:hypothetical protein GF396_00070 [Candidatus Pacearchaeota archaeon]|nr:hypothetical protein [Candidatus Pacearchaeota archaeon]
MSNIESAVFAAVNDSFCKGIIEAGKIRRSTESPEAERVLERLCELGILTSSGVDGFYQAPQQSLFPNARNKLRILGVVYRNGNRESMLPTEIAERARVAPELTVQLLTELQKKGAVKLESTGTEENLTARRTYEPDPRSWMWSRPISIPNRISHYSQTDYFTKDK